MNRLLLVAAALAASQATSCQGIPETVLLAELLPTVDGDSRAFAEIWPGDVLEVRHRNTPELDATVTVRPDGGISLPVAGHLQAAGLTPAELERSIEVECALELIRPEVTVIVTEFVGRTVHVGGEVNEPGAIPLIRATTMLETLMAAGGPLTTARLDSVLLIRRFEDGEWRSFGIDMAAVLAGEPGARNVRLRPTDVVFVPRSPIANVNLFIDQYIRENIPVFVSVRPDLGTNQ